MQGLSYPAMMARMVDRSNDGNRAVVVALFTGSFGVGINLSVLGWGFIANLQGLSVMFLVGGMMMFAAAAVYAWIFFGVKKQALPQGALLQERRRGSSPH